MNFLVIYGAFEGNTPKIAEFATNHLKCAGHNVELLDASRKSLVLDILSFDAVIIAGAVHQGIHHESITKFVGKHRKELQELPTLLISISLSIGFEDGRPAAEGYVNSFIDLSGFTPTKILMVADTMHSDHFDYFMVEIIELAKIDTCEMHDRSDDLTNWTLLELEIETFVELVFNNASDQDCMINQLALQKIDPLYDLFCDARIASVGRETVSLFYGEDIAINVTEMFEDCINRDASYLLINQPDWLSVNNKTGEIVGTVPLQVDNPLPLECIVYAIDDNGKSAKAFLILNGCEFHQPADVGSSDQEFEEGSLVAINTRDIFTKSGLDVVGLKFSATGLPEGLSINPNCGTIAGTLPSGSSRGCPYEITVTAADGAFNAIGISLQFDIKVIDFEKSGFAVDNIGLVESSDSGVSIDPIAET